MGEERSHFQKANFEIRATLINNNLNIQNILYLLALKEKIQNFDSKCRVERISINMLYLS